MTDIDPFSAPPLSDKLMQLRTRFLLKSPAKLRALQLKLQASGAHEASGMERVVEELSFFAHELVGVAPMLGLTSVSETAREMEELVRGIGNSEAANPEHIKQSLSKYLARLQQDFARAEGQ